MTNDHDSHDESPFGQGPFDAPPSDGGEARPEARPSGEAPLGGDEPPPQGPSGGGLLDDLRDLGEETVGAEIEAMATALRRVDEFTEHVDTADLVALQTEWREIEADLKRALASGLAAAQVTKGPVHDSVIAEEVQALEAEVERKNELIGQLSQSVDRMNRELDEKERSHRLERRGLRDRMVELDEEVGPLRERCARTEGQLTQQSEQLELYAEERDEARRSAQRSQATLESETSLHEERAATLETELAEVRKELASLDAERRAAERRAAELQRRLEAADAARAAAERERDARAQESGRSTREAAAAAKRAEEAESRLEAETARLEKDLKDLRRRESVLRAESAARQSRMQQALGALQGALSTLTSPPPGGAPEAGSLDEGTERGPGTGAGGHGDPRDSA